MTPEAIRELFNYSAWAFERVWACILRLSDEQFVQGISGTEWSIRHHVVHLASSITRVLARAEGTEPPPNLAFEDYPTPALARAKWDENQLVLDNYLGSLDHARLDEVAEWTIAARGIHYACPRWELLLHLANHATDHRAQILTLLRHEFGVPTVEQDMILYMGEAEKS